MKEDENLDEVAKMSPNVANIMANVLEKHSYSIAVS